MEDGIAYVQATSTFDAAHLFVVEAKKERAISAAEPRQSATSSGPASATARSPMEEAFWMEMGGDQAATDLPISPVSAGFTEQLDLDLHDSEI